jgi:hypothetical protein
VSAPRSSKTRKKSNRSSSSSTSSSQGRATPAGVSTVDPEFEKQIIALIKRFTGRSLLTSAIILVMCEYALQHSPRPREVLLPYALVSAFAVAFPYVRGAARTFKEIKQLGIKRFEKHRYADAKTALDYFHRFGQMSFDRDGEAHYYLVRTCLRMGDIESARKLDLWMQKHRSKFEWAARATSAVQEAERNSQINQHSASSSEVEHV